MCFFLMKHRKKKNMFKFPTQCCFQERMNSYSKTKSENIQKSLLWKDLHPNKVYFFIISFFESLLIFILYIIHLRVKYNDNKI